MDNNVNNSSSEYEALIMTPKEKVEEWAEIVKRKIKEGEQIVVFFDTETTGGVSGNIASVIEKVGKDEGKLHRIVELGAIVAIENKKTGTYTQLKDSSGDDIRFHEYINPWGENRNDLQRINSMNYMPFGAYNVHGISQKFLLGQERLGETLPHIESEFILPKPAPTMEEILTPFLKITGLDNIIEDFDIEKNIKVVAHNIEFDNKFMNSEFQLRGLSAFEAYCSPVCTLNIFRTILPKEEVKKYKLDTIYEYTRGLPNTQVENIPRDVHGAYIDSLMLFQVTNEVLRTNFAKNSPNAIYDEEEYTFENNKESRKITKTLAMFK